MTSRLPMDRDAIEAEDPYASLRLFAFLEKNTFGVIEQARRVRERGI